MNPVKNIFLSPDEDRLRAGWRLVGQTLLLVVISTCVLLPVAFNPQVLSSGKGFLFYQVAELIGVSLSVFLARRFLDKRSFRSLGLKIERQAGTDLLVGMGIPFFMIGLVYLLESAMGWLTFSGFAWGSDPLKTVLSETLVNLFIFILVGWNEELLSRGYHLQTLASGLNLPWGVLLSAAIFGGLHLGNPNASWVSALGVFLAGLFLTYAYLRSGQLWLPIGLHIGWNFFEGVVFGFPVSGMESYHLVRMVVDGPVSWTGGSFGPEEGLVVIPALLLGTGLVFVYTCKRRDRAKTKFHDELNAFLMET